MYNKILVPLDGSELGECSLAHVKAIATGCNTKEVVFLGVVEPIPYSGVLKAELGEKWSENAEQNAEKSTQSYLTEAAKKLDVGNITARTAILKGQAADEILEYVKNNQVDLIVISTHGSSGIARWAFGSVADKVARHSTVPVLIVTPTSCRIN
jgi:nucleotide-binding universal stress UspA family protein